MKKINTLEQKFKKLNNDLQKIPELSNLTAFDFFKYKWLFNRREHTKKQLQKSIKYARSTIFRCEEYEKKQLNNMKINCRQYYKRQQNAEFKRDFILYKLGLISKRPIIPALRPLVKLISKVFKPVSKYYIALKNKFKTFSSVILPQKINNVAVSAAKFGIRGYATLKSNCRYMKSQMKSNAYIQYLKQVAEQAQQQFMDATEHGMCPCTPEYQRAQIVHTTYSQMPHMHSAFNNQIQRRNISKIDRTR